jgi:hypothetical protein
VVESTAENAYDGMHRRRAANVDDVPEPAAQAPPADEQIDHRRRLGRAEEAIAKDEDADVKALFATIRKGNYDDERADHAAVLNWAPERVSSVHKKMDRRFKNARLLEEEEENHDDDDQAPRSRAR